MKPPPQLILLRHGQSAWNKRNIFTGWVDIPLSKEGVEEALEAGRRIAHLPVDVIFISSLVRAQMTAMLAMSVHQSGKVPYLIHPASEGKLSSWATIYSEKTVQECVPVVAAWQLNERMYGELQGMNKQEMKEKFGEEQVHIWRRSYAVAPPKGESLKMTAERTLPYFDKEIVPYLKQGKNVFVSAHGNSLRSIIMELDGLNEEQVVHLEIPTGEPLIYRYEEGKWLKQKG